jgi:drug/metabolite transporter (DMT)-like permease
LTNIKLQNVYLQLILSTFIWGSAFIAAKIAMDDLQPISVAFFRFLGASIVLWFIMIKREPIRPKLTKKDMFIFLILGLIGIFGYNVLFFYGVNLTTVTKSSLVIATNPILIAILSFTFLKEKVGALQFIGIILGIMGAFIIISNGYIFNLIELGFTKVDLILLGAVVCWATYSVVGKISLKRFSPLTSTTYACIVGTIFLLPFALYELSLEQIYQASISTWLSIAHMSVIVSALSFVLWYDGINKIGAAKAASFINLMPITAVVLASIVFEERITMIQLSGAILVLFGVYLSNRKPLSQRGVTSV